MLDRPKWDKYFLNICEKIAERSLDENTKLGCVITDARHRIVSTGYNSLPAGVNDNYWPKNRNDKLYAYKIKELADNIETRVIYDKEISLDNFGISTDTSNINLSFKKLGDITKYDVITHAEVNAIASSKCDLIGYTLYCTYLSCHECAKVIIASGIKKVVYLKENPNFERSHTIAKEMFKQANVELVQIND